MSSRKLLQMKSLSMVLRRCAEWRVGVFLVELVGLANSSSAIYRWALFADEMRSGEILRSASS
jgi:hypothetical protein